MSDRVLTVSNLSKKYSRRLRPSLTNAVRDIGRELWPRAGRPPRLRNDEYWALDDISFTLDRGEAIGIVGHNGAGKTSLLKLLYGLIKPDRGTIRISGRSEALLELGTGFNGLLSGRENIRIGAVLHGFDARRTRTLIDEVIGFAELGALIDAPVQTYSSGMRARLAYALAAQLKPDLLLVDEVLAVWDHAFQRKCLNHMNAYLEQGGSLVFVSHNVFQVQSICQRGILLDHGRAVFEGSAVATLDRLFDSEPFEPETAAGKAPADEPVAILEVGIESAKGGAIRRGGAVRITMACEVRQSSVVRWGFTIWTRDLWVCVTGAHHPESATIKPGRHVFSCVVPHFPLVAGRYMLRAGIVDIATGVPMAVHGWRDPPTTFDVSGTPSADANIEAALHQLVGVDVDWD
jgi:ABC-type polysaccharide/polyol phosphate transport system ATPase subunit